MSEIKYLLPSELIISNTNSRKNIIDKLIRFEKNGKVLFIFYDLKNQVIPEVITPNIFSNPAYLIYGNSINLNLLSPSISNFPTRYNKISYNTTSNYGPDGNAYKIISTPTDLEKVRQECNDTPSCTGFYRSGGMNSVYSLYNFNLENITPVKGPDLGTTFSKRINQIGAYAVKIFAYITIPISREYTFSVTNLDKIKLFLNSFLILNSVESKELSNTVFLSAGIYIVYIEKFALSNDNNLDISVTFTNNNIKTTVSLDTFNNLNYTPITNAIENRDNSILNFCNPNSNLFLSNNICETSLKNTNLLNDSVTNFCFNPLLNIDLSTKKINNNCHNILKKINTNINNNLQTSLNNKYKEWANTTINDSLTNFTNVDLALNEFIKDINPDHNTLFGNNKIASTNLIKYCENNIGDKFQADNNQNNLCNSLYSSTKFNIDKNIQSSIDNLKTQYCTKVINDKPRYETDAQCLPEYSKLLKDTIEKRCIQNGSFNYSDKWCTDISNTNINNKNSLYTNLTQIRTSDLKKNINTILVKEYENNKILDDNNFNYAINQYSTIPNSDKKITDELLNNKLLNYCENIEPNYPLNSKSQCKGIYDTYKNEKSIIDSRNKMRDSLCKNDQYILTNLPNDFKNNAFECKSNIFDTTNNLVKFAPTVNTYCSKNNNIISNECQTYYTDIENKILDSLYLIENNSKSTFDNNSKSTFDNTYINDYDKKIELSSFENLNYEDNNYIYLILLFIFIIVVIYASRSYFTFKYKYKKNKISN